MPDDDTSARAHFFSALRNLFKLVVAFLRLDVREQCYRRVREYPVSVIRSAKLYEMYFHSIDLIREFQMERESFVTSCTILPNIMGRRSPATLAKLFRRIPLNVECIGYWRSGGQFGRAVFSLRIILINFIRTGTMMSSNRLEMCIQ